MSTSSDTEILLLDCNLLGTVDGWRNRITTLAKLYGEKLPIQEVVPGIYML